MSRLDAKEVDEIKKLIKAWVKCDYSIAVTRQLTMQLQEVVRTYYGDEEISVAYTGIKPPFPHKSDLEKAVVAIGETIISRAEDIACNPMNTQKLTITGTIAPDEIVTVKWEVESFNDRLMVWKEKE